MTLRVRFRWPERGLLVLGLLLIGVWFETCLESRDFQSAESKRFDLALRAAAPGAAAVAPILAIAGASGSRPSKLGPEELGVLGRIEIPRLRIAAIVAEGTDGKTLGHAVGHIPFTARPGSPGNCALAGHRDTFLRGLGRVRVRDVIRIVTLDRTYAYRVVWTDVVEPQRVDVLDSTATRSLTLITCYPFVFVGHAPQRFVVRARQIEAVAGPEALQERGSAPFALTIERR